MTTMVELGAREIYEKRNGVGARAWKSLPKAHQEPYRDDMRAAIYAMREPTEAMIGAMPHGHRGEFLANWTAALDAAISEEA